MKHYVRKFKCLAIALKELEPLVKDARRLRTGRGSKAFGGLLPRELWANWLVCATLNAANGNEDLEFTTDPYGGDGVIWNGATGHTWPTEHVFVPPAQDPQQDPDALIRSAIEKKTSKGAAYGSGKTLVVFVDAGTDRPWFPNRVLRILPTPFHFDVAWVISLNSIGEAGDYAYDATCLLPGALHAPAYRLWVSADLRSWRTEQLQ